MHLPQGILIALLLATTLPGQIPSPVDPVAVAPPVLRERAERVLADGDCQTTLPGEVEDAGGRMPPELNRFGRNGPRQHGGAPAKDGSLRLPGLRLGSAFAAVVLWFALAVAVLVLVVVIVRAIGSRGEAPPRPAVPRAAPAPAPHAPEPVLADHEQLAAAGDFAAAIHALLLHAFALLDRRAGALPVGATGREVVRRAGELQLPTGSLGRLAQTVERLHFGGRPAERAHYEESVRHFAEWEGQCRPKP